MQYQTIAFNGKHAGLSPVECTTGNANGDPQKEFLGTTLKHITLPTSGAAVVRIDAFKGAKVYRVGLFYNSNSL